MAKLSILHISDIHIGNCNYEKADDIAIPIIEALETHSKSTDCVVVTGDIFDGKPSKDIDKVSVALEFLNYLKKELRKQDGSKLDSQDFIIIPGNHDLTRSESGANFESYRNLLKKFYGDTYFNKSIDSEFLFTTRIFKNQKVAIVGLNSCRLENSSLEAKEITWIEDIKGIDATQKNKILDALKTKKENEWDDFGFISKKQLRESFIKLEDEIEDLSDYTIVSCFHHHFYPFPEIYRQYGDSSIIRNFTDVIEKFQSKNVKVVLHGHKHVPIIRPVTNQKFLSNPDSIFYVFSAGSIGKKGVTNRSFQLIDVFNPEFSRIADVSRFNFNLEELQPPETFRVPPQKNYEENSYIELMSVFREEFPEEYNKYKSEVFECDNISDHYRINDIIQNISKTITLFDNVKKDFQSCSTKILAVLLSIHYRINYLNIKHNEDKSPRKFLNKLKKYFTDIVQDDIYTTALFKLLETNKVTSFDKAYENIMASHPKQRDITAYVASTIFFTDLFLTFSRYGEIYYAEENIKHNVNIKLEPNSFHENIPVSTIKIQSNVDRRLVTVNFKCKNPTVHKIAVLIVKDFEKRINKIEDSFKHLGLKLYYIVPQVEKDSYDLDNFNFEAYIPTLLPLLTGDNLYKKKEVFIRELIQNSLDAILLREDIFQKKNLPFDIEDKIIKVIFGTSKNPQTGKDRRFLKIIDRGIGMDTFKIERYFTSIGRSFYVSDEFDELQKNEDISYKPISNFGIGFLSAFMVCKEIEVLTKSYDNEDFGLAIHIPNYDGCFFIKKVYDNDLKTGTSITLYEDERKLLKPDNIIKYIKETFKDFQVDINIENQIKLKEENHSSFHIRRKNSNVLFVPISDDKVLNVSWLENIKTNKFIDEFKYGILVDFDSTSETRDRRKRHVYLNSGILLSDTNKNDLDFKENHGIQVYYNFPSSYIDLDVAREKILKFKNKYITKKTVIDILFSQALDYFDDVKENRKETRIESFNKLARFFKNNNIDSKQNNTLNKKLYSLNFNQRGKAFTISFKEGIKGNFPVNLSFPKMIKIYYKIIFELLDSDTSLFKPEENNFNAFYDNFNTKIDQYFDSQQIQNIGEGFLNQFVDEFNFRFEDDFHQYFNDMFTNHKSSKLRIRDMDEMFHRFSNEMFRGFDKEFSHGIANRRTNLKKEYDGLFDFNEGIMHEFDKVFNGLLKNMKQKVPMEKILYNLLNNRELGDDYRILTSLILSHILSNRRRDNRPHISISGIISIFYLFYEIMAKQLQIQDIKDFKLKI